MRIDKRVKALFPYLSNSQIEEAIKSGMVRSQGGLLLKKGDKDAIDLDTRELQRNIERSKEGNTELLIPVIYESPEYWVVDKPAGVATHPLKICDRNTLTHWAIARDSTLLEEFTDFQPTITPHRLDTDTSGLVIVARTRANFEKWRHRFSHANVTKFYLAWCWGQPTAKSFECHSAIAHDPKDSSRMVAVASGEPFAPPALSADSFIEVLEKRADKFLARVSCTTGVTHQVRVHLASLGYPLVGDLLYDPKRESRPDHYPHHLLRASKLIVSHEALSYEVDSSLFARLF